MNESLFPILRNWWIRLGPQKKWCGNAVTVPVVEYLVKELLR
tara:strand:- start:465 stop:590 length:126 start_codon:yes stop_codon:yes gene_type:complete